MKHLYLIVLIFVFGFQHSVAQNKSELALKGENPQTLNKKGVNNAIYFELAGNSVGYSFNYERRLGSNLWGRVGASYFPDVFVEFVAMPIGISYLSGKEAKFFEIGLVATPAYTEAELFFDSEDKRKEFGVIFSPTIGYRYQPAEEALFFKIALTPLFTTFEKVFVPSGGISLGYSF